MIRFQECSESLRVRVCSSVDVDLAIGVFLDVLRTDKLIRRNLSTGHKVFHWKSLSSHYDRTEISKTDEIALAAHISEKRSIIQAATLQVSFCFARHVILEPHTQHPVLVTASTSGVPLFNLKILAKSKQKMSSTQSVLGNLPLERFCTILTSSSSKAIQWPRRMVIAYGMGL